ncbi:MAG TPA: DUF3014 domain-containing protein [Rhodanobacteraceae bacterium]|nr:DUF3014 domain-containing protein [Rhodanobacteraceae bacterium]
MSKNASGLNWTIGVLALAAAIAAGVYLARRPAPVPASKPPSMTAPAPASAAAPLERHPITQAEVGPAPESPAPLPRLDDSDAAVADSLSALLGGDDLKGLLAAQAIIPRIVATIDALPKRQLAPNILPVQLPRGRFLTTRTDGRIVMSDANAARYATYARIADRIDTGALVAWYVRYYPLFQQAYRELGYPDGHFNDRLVFVIDQLLATPDLDAPAAVRPYKSGYAFVDARLESLSAGQKALIRVGPANEALIKDKLRGIRAALTGQAPPMPHGKPAE